MKFFRIFARLNRLERSRATHALALDGIVAEATDAYPSVRPSIHALHRRLERIEASMTACARCRGVVMVEKINEGHGPRLMEGQEADRVRRIIVCNGCEPYAKRDGWRLVNLKATPALKLVPDPETEVPDAAS